MEYLGHVILEDGVSTDPQKVVAMTDWPRPMNVKALRGFLGLIGYYRRFVKNYSIIGKPLTELLKKEGFLWGVEAKAAFDMLKRAMSEVPTLSLSDFNQPFVLEIDASNYGLGQCWHKGADH